MSIGQVVPVFLFLLLFHLIGGCYEAVQDVPAGIPALVQQDGFAAPPAQ